MAHDKGLPQVSEAQTIGQDAEDCLRSKRPRSWQITSVEGTADFGFDYQVQLTVGNQVVHPFRLQLKGTRSPQRNADGTHLSIALSTSTLRYYANTDEPVLLVLCDLSADPDEPRDGTLYYVWMREELERIDIDKVPLEQKEAVIHVPTRNVLNRSTDLVEEVRRRHRLSRVGHALDANVADLDPSLEEDERTRMVEAISAGIGARSLALAQSLAEPPDDIWVNPRQGSLPWHLTEAKAAIATGRLETCAQHLQLASEQLDKAASLERAEYWHLSGRLLRAQGDDEAASAALKTAADTHPLTRYWVTWAESQLRTRFRLEGGSPDYSDVLAALPADDEPSILGIRARLLAAAGKDDQALALLKKVDGPESSAARAVIHTMRSEPEEALGACLAGLASEQTAAATRRLFLLLLARARFNIALKGAQPVESHGDDEDDVLPPSGPIGVDPQALRLAWAAIEEAVTAMEETRWVANAEFLADIWVATASMLAIQEQVKDRVLAAARTRPDNAALQTAAETIAAQCGDFKAALEANGRTPEGERRTLRRVAFLNELGKHKDCTELMEGEFSRLSHSQALYGPTLVSAALSADVMARDDLVGAWRSTLLAGDSELRAHAATLDFLLAIRRNRLERAQALKELRRADSELGHPRPTTILLFHELDAGEKDQAPYFLEVVARLRALFRLSPMVAVRTGVALATLGRWGDLLALCQEALREFEVPGRMQAFHALALDQLGRADEARQILQRMLEEGADDSLALDTYVNLMVRWGFVDKARTAAELILERAPTRERQFDCVRMLFNLEKQEDPASPRLARLAFRLGALADPTDEAEEGAFLGMVTVATSFPEASLSKDQQTEFGRRANAFFERFPTSKVFRRIDVPSAATPEELLNTLRSAIGFSEEREKARAEMEEKLNQGELPLPFAWRPRHALGGVQDVAHLWEFAKRSSIDERKFHLDMTTDAWRQRSAADLRAKPPLLDLLTLFVLKDLDLLEHVFAFFPEVAISRETASELMRMVQPFSGSIMREQCVDLQNRLRPHLGKILQPPAGPPEEDDEKLPARDTKALIATGRFTLYSDDALLRFYLLREPHAATGMCTLDLLLALEEVGALTTWDVGAKIAQLCEWNVRLQIPFRCQLALIPRPGRAVTSVQEGKALIEQAKEFMSIASALWGPKADFDPSRRNFASAAWLMLQDLNHSEVMIASFFAVWIDRVQLRAGNRMPGDELAAAAAVYVAGCERPSIALSQRLWSIYVRLQEHLAGALCPAAAQTALVQMAELAAKLDQRASRQSGAPVREIGERLMLGLKRSSTAWVVFSDAYARTR